MLNEHFFLTDPSDLLLTHFPYVDNDDGYDKWQLVEKPISLDEFSCKPHLSHTFFSLGLQLTEQVPTPLVVEDTAILKIKGWEVIHYKVSSKTCLRSST